MMTMHVLSAGDGYAYYTSEVATGDAKRESGRELGDYYTADGNPPGVWMGSGIDLLGVSGTVTEDQMRALFGEGLHPDAERLIAEAQEAGASVEAAIASTKLGRSYYRYGTPSQALKAQIQEGFDAYERTHDRAPSVEDRRKIRTRIGAAAFRDAKGRDAEDAAELAQFISAASRPSQQAVAGFDHVFSPAKSVSVLWALGDDDTRKSIETAHEKSIAATIRYLEREAIATRAGVNGAAQISVERGIVATRFRHYDSRNGDPQLHDHLVVANKVKGADGKWRTIDSKLLHRQAVAASEFYNTRVMDEVTTRLGLAVEFREVTPGKRPVAEIAGIDTTLTEQFSSRSRDIRARVHELEQDYVTAHGRAPSVKARMQLAQQATLDTRLEKSHARSLSELRAGWRAQAEAAVGTPTIDGLLDHARATAREHAEARTPVVFDSEVAAREVVSTVSEHHSVWGAHMIEAEARRWVQHHHSAHGRLPADAVETITKTALAGHSVTVTPPHPHSAFQPLTRDDGRSIYDHKGRTLFTSSTILTAEDILLDAGRDRTSSPVEAAAFERAATAARGPLDAGQHALARAFACDPAVLSVGVGPAGSGKTTALKLMVAAAQKDGVAVVGLAPSAAAARVMEDSMGVRARTIHSLTHAVPDTILTTDPATEPRTLEWLKPGSIIVVDEAGMAGTVNLAKVVRIAQIHGAHVRLLGDDAQLSAVEAGGSFGMLERELGATHLDELHRFQDAEEAAATLILRDPTHTSDPFRWYLDNDRVVTGTADQLTGKVFQAWQTDTDAGKRSLMMAPTNEQVATLNAQAQAYRMSRGQVRGNTGVDLRDGLTAHAGDTIVTRSNNSDLKLSQGREIVKNGDLWTVTKAHKDGSLTVRHDTHGGRITLPAEYTSRSVELGYACTGHRAQGLTVDTSHGILDESTTRSSAYVLGSRGIEANHFYVISDIAQPVAEVLDRISANTDDPAAAHDVIRAEQARVDDLVTLIDQYADVSDRADALRYKAVTEHVVGAPQAAALQREDSWGAVEAAMRRAERAQMDPADLLVQSWQERPVDGAENLPAMLSVRMDRNIDTYQGALPYTPAPVDPVIPTWIAERRSLDSAHTDPAWKEHLQERYDYLATRLHERGTAIAAEPPGWAADLGQVPSSGPKRQAWVQLAAEVSTLRDRYGVDPADPLAVPVTLREHPVGADLAARVTAAHKSSALTTRPEASQVRRDVEHTLALMKARSHRDQITPPERNTTTMPTPTTTVSTAETEANDAALRTKQAADLQLAREEELRLAQRLTEAEREQVRSAGVDPDARTHTAAETARARHDDTTDAHLGRER
jgi:conjugative relaxase-like TrwC/TraI family protein